MAQGPHCDLLFVGSIPLENAREVLSVLGATFSRYLKRYPDGETGERAGWVQYQGRFFAANDAFEPVEAERDWRNQWAPQGKRLDTQYRLKPGISPDAVRFGSLGYAEPAISSYSEFRTLKAAGVIPAAARFMVAVPSPYNVMSWGVAADARLAIEAPYQTALLAEIDRICAHVPHDELAIQWDCAHDMRAFDGARQTYFQPSKPGIIERLVTIGNRIPPKVELGYHLCYGSFGGRHFVEPKDARAMVDLANGVAAGIQRPIEWIHMPVPIERSDDAYFAPLADLRTANSTTIYLGLIHETDGVEGTRSKIAAAERFLEDFGLSTECGFGRQSPDVARRLIGVHARLFAELC